MKTITIISGPQGSGKTTCAMNLTEGKKALWIFDGGFGIEMRTCDDDDFLVFDDLNFFQMGFQLKRILRESTMEIRRPYARKLETIIIPDIILITHCDIQLEDVLSLSDGKLIFIKIGANYQGQMFERNPITGSEVKFLKNAGQSEAIEPDNNTRRYSPLTPQMTNKHRFLAGHEFKLSNDEYDYNRYRLENNRPTMTKGIIVQTDINNEGRFEACIESIGSKGFKAYSSILGQVKFATTPYTKLIFTKPLTSEPTC